MKVVLALVSVVFAVLLGELVLWMCNYHYCPLDIERDGGVSDWRVYHAFEDYRFRFDLKVFWRPRENRSVFNAQGFRGDPLPAVKQPDEYRVFTLGDSNTLGWDFDPKNMIHGGANWPMHLEELLRKRGPGYSVTNAGVYGYTSYQGFVLMEEVLSYQPDMILVSFGANDALRAAASDVQFAESMLEFPLQTTRLGQLVRAAWDRLHARATPAEARRAVPRVSLSEYRCNLIEIISLARQHGAECVLLTRPFIGVSKDKLWWKYFAPEYVQATLDVGRENDALVVDIHALFKDQSNYFTDESHFDKPGHRRAAKLIYERIKPLLP